jgi:hypothetical protein
MLRPVTPDAIDPVVRDLCRTLLPRIDEFAERMATRIRAQEPLYRDGHVVTPDELRRSCRNNLSYVFGRLAGEPTIGIEVPRATGIRRGETGVPLSAVLQAFRIGGRLIWDILIEHANEHTRDVLLRSAADIWAVSDDLAAAAAEGYRIASADRARQDSQLRSALLNGLLDGRLGDGSQLWESAALLKLPQHGAFVVVAAECPAPGQEALPEIEDRLRRHDVASAWRLDAELQEGLVSLRPRFGLEQLCTELEPIASGRVGLSEPYPSLDQAPTALRQAQLACAAATPGTTSLIRFDDEPIAVLLVSAPDASFSVARRILGPVLDLPDSDRILLIDTMRTWLAEAGSTSAAAGRLHVHRNTVRYRLRRLEELTGRKLTDPLDVSELHVALECARMLGLG